MAIADPPKKAPAALGIFVPDEEPTEDELDRLLGTEPRQRRERELAEAVLHELLEVVWDEKLHPRWPDNAEDPVTHHHIGGQFMKIGERFFKDGHEWEIEHVAKGHVIAHESSGKFSQAETRVFAPDQIGGHNTIKDAVPAPIPVLKKGQGASYNEVPHVPVVKAGAEHDHDPTIHLPAGSPLTEEEWQRFGKADQLLYVALGERFGPWKQGFAQKRLPSVWKNYSAAAREAVRAAFKHQYGAGYGTSAGDFLSLQEVFDNYPPNQAKQIYREGREIQGEIKEINAWELYNRLHAPDLSLFHGGGGGTHNKKLVNGTGALKPGYSTSWAHSKAANWGGSVTAYAIAARNVLLASDISKPPGAQGYMGEAEISNGDRLLLGPDIAHNYKASTLDPGLSKWVNDHFSYGKGGMRPGSLVQAMISHMKGGEPLPIPPPPPNVVMDHEGKKATYLIPDGSVISHAASLAKSAGYWKGESPEAALKPISDLDLKPGDLIEGHTQGKRYLVIADPGASTGMAYMKLDGSNTVFGFSSMSSERRKLDQSVTIPPPPPPAGVPPFNPDEWVQAGELEPLGKMNDGDKVALTGDYYEITGKSGSYVLIKSLTTGKTGHANAGAVTAALGPKPGITPVGYEGPEPAFEPEVGKPALIKNAAGTGVVVNVIDTAPPHAAAGSVAVEYPAGSKATTQLSSLSAPPVLPKLKPQKGDTFTVDGTKFTVSNVLKDGTVSAKPVGGKVQKFAPGAPELENLVRPGDYQIGEKGKLGAMEPGALVSGSPAKVKPYMVLGTVGKQTYLKNLDTGETTAVSKGKSYPSLVDKAAAIDAHHHDGAGTDKIGVPHDQWNVGDKIHSQDLQPSDKFKLETSTYTVVGESMHGGEPTWEIQGSSGVKTWIPKNLSTTGDSELTYLGKADTPTLPSESTDPESLPDALTVGFQPFKSGYGPGGKYKHDQLKTLAEGEHFVDKTGKLYKVKTAGDTPIITDGQKLYKVDGKLRVKRAEHVTGGYTPLVDKSPPVGAPSDAASKAAFDSLQDNVSSQSFSELGLKPGDQFQYNAHVWTVDTIGEGGGLSATSVDAPHSKAFMPWDVPAGYKKVEGAPGAKPAPHAAGGPHAPELAPNWSGATLANLGVSPGDTLDFGGSATPGALPAGTYNVTGVDVESDADDAGHGVHVELENTATGYKTTVSGLFVPSGYAKVTPAAEPAPESKAYKAFGDIAVGHQWKDSGGTVWQKVDSESAVVVQDVPGGMKKGLTIDYFTPDTMVDVSPAVSDDTPAVPAAPEGAPGLTEEQAWDVVQQAGVNSAAPGVFGAAYAPDGTQITYTGGGTHTLTTVNGKSYSGLSANQAVAMLQNPPEVPQADMPVGPGVATAQDLKKGHHFKIQVNGKGAEYEVMEDAQDGDPTIKVQTLVGGIEYDWNGWSKPGKPVLITKSPPTPTAPQPQADMDGTPLKPGDPVSYDGMPGLTYMGPHPDNPDFAQLSGTLSTTGPSPLPHALHKIKKVEPEELPQVTDMPPAEPSAPPLAGTTPKTVGELNVGDQYEFPGSSAVLHVDAKDETSITVNGEEFPLDTPFKQPPHIIHKAPVAAEPIGEPQEMPIKPYGSAYQSGGKKPYHKIEDLQPGDKFTDKTGKVYTVIYTNPDSTTAQTNGTIVHIPHTFTDDKGKVKPTRVKKIEGAANAPALKPLDVANDFLAGNFTTHGQWHTELEGNFAVLYYGHGSEGYPVAYSDADGLIHITPASHGPAVDTVKQQIAAAEVGDVPLPEGVTTAASQAALTGEIEAEKAGITPPPAQASSYGDLPNGTKFTTVAPPNYGQSGAVIVHAPDKVYVKEGSGTASGWAKPDEGGPAVNFSNEHQVTPVAEPNPEPPAPPAPRAPRIAAPFGPASTTKVTASSLPAYTVAEHAGVLHYKTSSGSGKWFQLGTPDGKNFKQTKMAPVDVLTPSPDDLEPTGMTHDLQSLPVGAVFSVPNGKQYMVIANDGNGVHSISITAPPYSGVGYSTDKHEIAWTGPGTHVDVPSYKLKTAPEPAAAEPEAPSGEQAAWADLAVGDVVKVEDMKNPFKIIGDNGDSWQIQSQGDGSQTHIQKYTDDTVVKIGHEPTVPAPINDEHATAIDMADKWMQGQNIPAAKIATVHQNVANYIAAHPEDTFGNAYGSAISAQAPDASSPWGYNSISDSINKAVGATPQPTTPEGAMVQVNNLKPGDKILKDGEPYIVNGSSFDGDHWSLTSESGWHSTTIPKDDAYVEHVGYGEPKYPNPDEPVPLPPHEATESPIPDYSGTELSTKGGAGGSTGAQYMEGPGGQTWLKKSYGGNEDRVATELLANSVYRELGVKVAKAGAWKSNLPGSPVQLAYPLESGSPAKFSTKYGGDTEKRRALGRNYMTDALLGNYDFVGLDDDNVLWNGDEPTRIDQGGTFEYRAQGGKKDFGNVPTEVFSMLSKGQGQRGVLTSESSMRKQAKEIGDTLTDAKIDQLADAAPFTDEQMRDRYRNTLKARVEWMREFGNGQHEIPPEVAKQLEADPPPTAAGAEQTQAVNAAGQWLEGHGLTSSEVSAIHKYAQQSHDQGHSWTVSYESAIDPAVHPDVSLLAGDPNTGIAAHIAQASGQASAPSSTLGPMPIKNTFGVIQSLYNGEKAVNNTGSLWTTVEPDGTTVLHSHGKPIALFTPDETAWFTTEPGTSIGPVKNMKGMFQSKDVPQAELEQRIAQAQGKGEHLGTATHVSEMPIKPYGSAYQSGGKAPYHKISELTPGSQFQDKSGTMYRVVSVSASVAIVQPLTPPGAATIAVPLNFTDAKGNVKPTRVKATLLA